MTIGGWVLFIIIAVIIAGICTFVGIGIGDTTGAIIGLLVAVIINIFVFAGFQWYYNNTASGARAFKTQESNFNMGMNRRVTVYDMEGDIIMEYEGKFDVVYDNDRILFDNIGG